MVKSRQLRWYGKHSNKDGKISKRSIQTTKQLVITL